jgi:hypothetical protein
MAIQDLYGKILAMGVQCIRKATPMPALINQVSYDDPNSPKGLGGNVEVIIPPEFTTRNVVPGSTPPASQAAPNPTTVQVPLDNWKEVNFPLTTRDIALMENSDSYIPMFLANAAAAIADDISQSIFQQYRGVYGFVGTAGTTPFATSPVAAQNAKARLTQQRCPKQNRVLVLDSDAYGNATGLHAFSSALNYGNPEVILEGEIRRAYGFQWFEDLNVPTHVAGSAANYVTAAAAPGAVTTTISGGTGSFNIGDIFSVAGDPATYTVINHSGGNLSFMPSVRVAWAANAAITRRSSHVVNMAFHPMAFAFASRPAARLMLPELQGGKVVATWVDEPPPNGSGVTLRLVIQDEYHQTGFYLSCLWGSKLVDARLVTRVAG